MTQLPRLRSHLRDFYVGKLLQSHTAWRYGLNARSTVAFVRDKPVLGGESKRLLEDLNDNGVARSTLEALTGSTTLLGDLQAEARRLEDAKADLIAEKKRELLTADLGDGNDKSFVVTMLDHDRPVVGPDDFLAKLALEEQLKGIADHYYGLRSRVTDINIWRNLPTGKGPVASQLWHRDQPEDHLILKMFVYLEDVSDGAGPFSYVLGTHGKGDRKWGPPTTFDGHNWRAGDETMEALVEPERRPRFTAPAGTVLFADTTGWHRGGHAVTESRFVLQVLYASDAALPDRMLGVPEGFTRSAVPRDLKYDLRNAS